MTCYALSHHADSTTAQELAMLVTGIAPPPPSSSAHIAELDERTALSAGGMQFDVCYCVASCTWSEDMAFQAHPGARAARKFPAIFPGWPMAGCT